MYINVLSIIPLLGLVSLNFNRSNPAKRRLVVLFTILFVYILSLFLLINNNLIVADLFIILTTFLIPGTVLASWHSIKKISNLYLGSILILESCLLGVFSSNDVISFYVFFEASLIPLFILLGYFGGSNRERATYLLFLYTLFGSLFLLIGLILLVQNSGSIYFDQIKLTSLQNQNLIWLLIFFSLSVKTPIVPIHIWLPRAHAEASVGGSIILAGVVLKLATFGFIRLLIDLIPETTSYWTPLVEVSCLISLIYASLSALRQIDIKVLIAISSVAHIAIVLLGLFSNTLNGISGGILLSLAHGLISPCLFFLLGGCLYDRYHVRILRYYRGLALQMPLFSIYFFIATCANIGVPLTFNFIGEFLSLTGIFERSSISGIIASFSVVLSAGYSLWIFSRITFGDFSKNLYFSQDINRREFHILTPWILLTLFFGIYPQSVLNLICFNLTTLLY